MRNSNTHKLRLTSGQSMNRRGVNCIGLANHRVLISFSSQLRKRFRHFMLSGAAFAVLTLLASPTLAQRNGGYVLSLRGNWFLKTSKKPLKRFGEIPAGATVIVKKPIDKADYITIALFRGETIRRTCRADLRCGAPIDIPKLGKTNGRLEGATASVSETKPAPRSLIGRLSETFLSLFEHPSRYYVVTKARPGNLPFRDIVTSQESGKVDLSSVFRDVPPATYPLIAVPLSPDNPEESVPNAANISFKIEWNTREPKLATTDRLYPGLFRLVSGSYFQSWILVTKSEQYPAVSRCVESAIKNANEWVPDTDQLAAKMFFRAYLANLAKDLQQLSNPDGSRLTCSEGR